jgi:hypothetical protein
MTWMRPEPPLREGSFRRVRRGDVRGLAEPSPLLLADQDPIEFGEAPMTESMRFAMGESSPVKSRSP